MDIKEQVNQWASEALAETPYFVVEVAMSPGGRNLTVTLDGEGGVTIEQCAQLSRFLGDKLEENEAMENAYQLVVQSPGVGSLLKMKEQYPLNLNRTLNVVTIDGDKIVGKLTEATETEITLTFSQKEPGKKAETIQKTVAYEAIAKAFVEITFN
jgi:ribosome maturation factor RimP